MVWVPRVAGSVPFVIQGCRTSGCKNGILCDASRPILPPRHYIPRECAILSKIVTAIRRNVQDVILQRAPCTWNPSFSYPHGHNAIQDVTDKITSCTVFKREAPGKRQGIGQGGDPMLGNHLRPLSSWLFSTKLGKRAVSQKDKTFKFPIGLSGIYKAKIRACQSSQNRTFHATFRQIRVNGPRLQWSTGAFGEKA